MNEHHIRHQTMKIKHRVQKNLNQDYQLYQIPLIHRINKEENLTQ